MIKKIVCALTVCSLIAVSASAVPSIKLHKGPYFGSTGGGEFQVEMVSGWSSTPTSLEYDKGFESFCLETNEWISFERTYYVEFSYVAINGGVGGKVPNPAGGTMDPLDEKTAYLYHQFMTSSLTGYDYDNSGIGRVTTADALQYAIWFIEEEITSIPSSVDPNTKFYAEMFLADANDAVTTGKWTGLGSVRVMNVYSYGYRGCIRNKQDLLVMIPAPSAILLSGIGVCFVGWLRRCRKF